MSPATPRAPDPDWQGQVARLVNGMPIEVDPRDMVGSAILRSGVWEPETAWFFGQWLRPGMTVVDAGAHAGQYPLLASGLASYEPVTERAANVIAVRHLTTLLSGLPEPVAAATLLRLARRGLAPDR
jgi:hypothetical protein